MKNNTPAVLFYSQDFMTGVADMTMEERGYYITLLAHQNIHGHMSEEYIRRIAPGCPAYVLEKFLRDEDGAYFNKRMEEEIGKRNKFKDSRYKNLRQNGSPTSKSDMKTDKATDIGADIDDRYRRPISDSDMETETEIESNIKEIDRGVGEGRGKNKPSQMAQEFVDAFHALCPSLKPVTRLTDKRVKKINARLKEFTPEEIRRAFEHIEASDFATGRTGRWTCTFDWLIDSEAHMTKALEDVYGNRVKESSLEKAHREFMRELDEIEKGDAYERTGYHAAGRTGTDGAGYRAPYRLL